MAGDKEDRALGALLGGALGDAMGMPTQMLSLAEIARAHGYVDGFVAPGDDHPVSRGLAAGTVTDDTEQTLLLARLLLDSPDDGFDHDAWVAALLDWEKDVKARGIHDLLGPSTKRALLAIAGGTPPEEAGRAGDTNGAAMRIAPIGIITRPDPLAELVDRVAETCRATHNTSVGIAAASAVAAAISSGIEGADWRSATDTAVSAATAARDRGEWVAGADIAARVGWARELVDGVPSDTAATRIVTLIGTSVAAQESVPAAFAVLAAVRGDAWQAAVLAANLGGDTDTIGAIASSIAGACTGASALPAERIAELRGIDPAKAQTLARALLARRSG